MFYVVISIESKALGDVLYVFIFLYMKINFQ